jgi:hypothetical protein
MTIIHSWHGSEEEITAIEKAGFKDSYTGKEGASHLNPVDGDPFDIAKKIYNSSDSNINVAIIRQGTFSFNEDTVVAVSDNAFRSR